MSWCGRTAAAESPDAPMDLRPSASFEDRPALPGRQGHSARRRRARPLADRWTGSRSEFAGRGELWLEARGDFKWARRAPRCSPPMRPSAGLLPNGSSCKAGRSWLLPTGARNQALRQLFSELLTDPNNIRRMSRPLLSGADNHYSLGEMRIRSLNAGCPTSLWRHRANQRIAELGRGGPAVLVDLTESERGRSRGDRIADELTLTAGRPVGEIAATAVLVRPDGYVAWARQHGPTRTNCENCVACLRIGSVSSRFYCWSTEHGTNHIAVQFGSVRVAAWRTPLSSSGSIKEAP